MNASQETGTNLNGTWIAVAKSDVAGSRRMTPAMQAAHPNRAYPKEHDCGAG